MKKINKIILWVIVAFFVFFILTNIGVALFAKKIVTQQIEKNLKLPSSLNGISISLPFSINLAGLKVGDLFEADKVSVSPNIFGFLAGKIVLNKVTLVNPVVTLVESGDGSFNLPKLEQKGKPPPVYLAALTIKNGRFNFIDKKINPDGYYIILGSINTDISKVMFPPTSLKANFNISFDLLSIENKKIGDIDFSGWADFGPKDMNATLNIRGLEVTHFSPYYGNFISNKKLLGAKLDTKVNLKSENNNLDILTKLKLSNLVYAKNEPQEGELAELNLAKNALDLFTDAKGNLNLDFEINTKLDNPQISVAQLQKIILRAAAKNMASQSPEDLIKKVSGNIDQFKAIGKSLKAMFKGKE